MTTEESRFYVSFRIRAALRMQLIVTLKSLFICIRLWLKCPHSCGCSSSPEKEFFFLSFFLESQTSSQFARALNFSRLKFECQRRFEGSRRRRRPSSLPRSCDFVTLPPSQRGALTLSSSPPLIIILSPVNLQVRC